MPTTNFIKVEYVFQDLNNLRNVPQKDEKSAMKALIAVNPDYFYGLMESIIESGYLPLESIVVIQHNAKNFTVHEGNRRIAILKILLGLYKPEDFDLPQPIINQLPLSKKWLADNSTVPCLIYKPADKKTVDRIVGMVHGKGDRAGRLKWNSVARAREARDVNGKSQPGLDLLEKYLEKGKNLNQRQKEQWSGEYNLTVLDEAITKLLPRLSLTSTADLVSKYPSITHRKELEELLHAIGTGTIGFPAIRSTTDDVFVRYGFPALPAPKGGSKTSPAGGGKGGKAGGKGGKSGSKTSKKKGRAFPSNDPRTVAKLLTGFQPTGKDREKVVDLKEEGIKLKIDKTPLAFCFVLRSMFEISAKAYCGDHGIALNITKVKPDGTKKVSQKDLSTLLGEVSDHLIAAAEAAGDKELKKSLHGAKVELTNKNGILSVTSLNQLVHNPSFSIRPADISRLFVNIFPLLEHMN